MIDNIENTDAAGNIRLIVSMGMGLATAFVLFWIMQALVSVTGTLDEAGAPFSVDFVRLKRDSTPPTKQREKPQREKPKQQPPPPVLNVAKSMKPGDSIGVIVPTLDVGAALGAATSLGTGAGGTRDAVPLVRVQPVYPPRAEAQDIGGYVVIEFTITAVGTVADAVVLDSKPPYVFDRSALRAVRKFRYAPMMEDGEAVSRSGQQQRFVFNPPKGAR